jgi:hypothetical protein
MRRGFARALGVVLVLAMAGLSGSAQPSPPQGFLVQFEWQMDDPLFGGLSAVDVADDGLGLTVLSDSGAYAMGTIARDAAGQITNVTLAPFRRLKGLEDKPLAKGRDDSEGLAIDVQGAVYISFEGVARVLRYADISGSAENLPTPAEFKKLQHNSALEALAIDGDGVLYTIPERSGAATRPFPVFRFRNGVWDKNLSLPRTDGFMPVGADFGPDGRLYILLRQFHGLAGFSSRLIRTIVGEDSLGQIEVLIQSPVGYHSNLEGVSIWRDGAGYLRATMIADNNYLPFLANAIVEYRLPD